MAGQAAPDLDQARRFLSGHPPPGRVALCAVVGAHQAGVVPPDGGYELAAVHLVPSRALLGLDPRPVRHTGTGSIDGVGATLVSEELAPTLHAVVNGDGRVLEHLLSPWQVITTTLLEPLQHHARGAISQRFAAHYRARFDEVSDAHANRPTPASMLAVYQIALTGVHLLRAGRVEANVGVLASYYGYPGANELAELVRTGLGQQLLSGSLAAHHQARVAILGDALEDAAVTSQLPPDAPNRRALESWLVDLRVAELR